MPAWEQLQVDLEAIWEQQLSEQVQIFERFCGNVAAVCERDTINGYDVAKALHGLQVASKSRNNGLPLGTLRSTERDAMSALPQSSEFEAQCRSSVPVDLLMPPAVGCPVSPVRSQTRKVSPAISLESSPIVVGVVTPKSSVDEQDAADLKTEFAIAKCNFISDHCEIIKPPCEFTKMLGPTAAKIMRHFSSSSLRKASGKFADFVDGSVFKILSILVICFNFAFIIVQTDHKMSHLNADKPSSHSIVEMCFTIFYTFELGVQILVHRKVFFFGPDMVWNWFDSVIVIVAVVELVLSALGQSKGNMSFLRVLRFLKVSRVFRMFNAMRIFKEIRLMVDSLMGSFVFFVWCAGMLGLFLSLFAIFFVQAMTTLLEDRDDLDEGIRKAILVDFGSVSGAMLTLLMAATGGNDWGVYHLTIKQLGAVYTYLYLFFILFSSMAFFNVITSVFCEKAMHLARPTMDEIAVEMKRKEVRDASELLKMLNTILKDDVKRTLDYDAFEEFLRHPKAVAYFELRGLNESSVRRFFKQLLRIHQTSSLDFATFASACVKLNGTASSIDVHMLSAELKGVKLAQLRLQEDLSKACVLMARESPVRQRAPAMLQSSPAMFSSPALLSVASPCRKHVPPPTAAFSKSMFSPRRLLSPAPNEFSPMRGQATSPSQLHCHFRSLAENSPKESSEFARLQQILLEGPPESGHGGHLDDGDSCGGGDVSPHSTTIVIPPSDAETPAKTMTPSRSRLDFSV